MKKKHEPLTEGQIAAIKARAKAATPGPWSVKCEILEADECGNATAEMPYVSTNDKAICVLYGRGHDDANAHEDAAFIAHAREDIPALLAEVERLLAEVARLKDEVASLEQELKFSDETEYELIKKLFDLKICHKEWICEQDGSSELSFEGENGCLFCWRQWAIMKARKEVGEEVSHE